MFLCTPFANHCWYTATGLYITLHSPSARLDSIHPICRFIWSGFGIRDSPDHHSVRNKEVKFVWVYSLGPRFSVSCPYIERVRIIEIFFKRKYMRSLSAHWKLSVIERCPYREVRLYLVYRAKIFKENWNCYSFSLCRIFNFLASSDNDKPLLMRQKRETRVRL